MKDLPDRVFRKMAKSVGAVWESFCRWEYSYTKNWWKWLLYKSLFYEVKICVC